MNDKTYSLATIIVNLESGKDYEYANVLVNDLQTLIDNTISVHPTMTSMVVSFAVIPQNSQR